MSTHSDLGRLVLSGLEQTYSLRKKDLGADACLQKSGMRFETEAYAVEDLGHLCILRMKAFLGLMKMETVVLAVNRRDVPLLNLDWVNAAGKETQIVELYDTQLQPCPGEVLAAYQALRDRDADLPDPPASAPRWYDEILYPCSYHKAGRGLAERLNAAARDYFGEYLRNLKTAPLCDEAEKGARTRGFAETLLAKGGPAVDMVTKLFGEETARRLVLHHMYGAEE